MYEINKQTEEEEEEKKHTTTKINDPKAKFLINEIRIEANQTRTTKLQYSISDICFVSICFGMEKRIQRLKQTLDKRDNGRA